MCIYEGTYIPQYARGHQETTLGTLLYYVFLGIEFRMPDLETSTLNTQQYLWTNLEILKISLDFSSLVEIQA